MLNQLRCFRFDPLDVASWPDPVTVLGEALWAELVQIRTAVWQDTLGPGLESYTADVRRCLTDRRSAAAEGVGQQPGPDAVRRADAARQPCPSWRALA